MLIPCFNLSSTHSNPALSVALHQDDFLDHFKPREILGEVRTGGTNFRQVCQVISNNVLRFSTYFCYNLVAELSRILGIGFGLEYSKLRDAISGLTPRKTKHDKGNSDQNLVIFQLAMLVLRAKFLKPIQVAIPSYAVSATKPAPQSRLWRREMHHHWVPTKTHLQKHILWFAKADSTQHKQLGVSNRFLLNPLLVGNVPIRLPSWERSPIPYNRKGTCESISFPNFAFGGFFGRTVPLVYTLPET